MRFPSKPKPTKQTYYCRARKGATVVRIRATSEASARIQAAKILDVKSPAEVEVE